MERRQTKAPVLQVVVSKVDKMTEAVSKFEFSMPDGSKMPTVTAGAQIDVVVAPDFLKILKRSHGQIKSHVISPMKVAELRFPTC